MIGAAISGFGGALSRLSDVEFFAALGVLLFSVVGLTAIGVLYRSPGLRRQDRMAARPTRAA